MKPQNAQQNAEQVLSGKYSVILKGFNYATMLGDR